MADHYLTEILGDREKILLVTRQHWARLIPSFIINLLLALVIVGVATGIYFFAFKNTLIFLLLGLLGIPMVRVIDHYMNWLNEEYVITNFRVIQLEGVFSKKVTDSSLDKVNDVKMEQTFLGRIFKYGDVEILTASELGVNNFKAILNPIQFKTAMLNAKEELEHQSLPAQPAQAGEPTTQDIIAAITQLDHLHLNGTISDDEFKKKKAELLSRI